MKPNDIEQWVVEVVDALRPRLLAQARTCHRLRLAARPPEEVAALIADGVQARLRTSVEETERTGAAERPET
ncbi:hypothetical protein [Nocardioides xinjiangensis]|uniref:hypothetical protein n=1 Tax=Nocardioides xinjiangensis TaxID=2817376 RepID=UPI001B3023DA|nr:hypothetical protein [Nocardioides sp. SYSU D00778]